jgi:TonB-linked SusC/RagA family outer membrane protein
MKTYLNIFVVLAIQSLFLSQVNAQTIKGKVTDSKGEALIGTTILEIGTTNASITNLDGEFTLTLKDANSTLLISNLGYDDLELKPLGKTYLELVLQENTKTLDEVVVVGYGVQKRNSVTGSVSSVSAEKLKKLPTDNVSNMLAGRLTGLVTRQTSGVPGENGSSFYIRGISTTGNSSPLVLVDGVERDFQNLDPSEIETITVLKDAATSSIYGVRGANGVILVTTKRGSSAEKITVTYNGSFSASTNANFPKFLNGIEFAEYHNKAKTLDGQPIEFDEQRIGYIKNGNDPMGVWGNTDWFKLIFKPYAPGTSHTLNLSGGTEKLRFFAGTNYLKQDGIIDRVSFNRFNLRSNLDVKIANNLTLKIDIAGRSEQRNQPGVTPGSADPSASTANGGATMGYKNIVFYAISAAPVVNKQMPDGTYIGANNPLIARDESGFTDRKTKSVQTSMSLVYDASDLIKGLKFSTLIGYDFSNTFFKELLLPHEQITPQYATGLGVGSTQVMTPGFSPHLPSGKNELTDATSYFSRYTFQAIANYNRKFGKHDLGTDFVWEQSGSYSNSFGASKQNLPITQIPDLNFGTEIVPNSVYGSHGQGGRAGFVTRINYSFMDKYMLQFSGRADWSPKFSPENRLGLFPSLSFGWRISEEAFIKENTKLSFINNLKIRGSWGILGNDAIANYLYVQGMGLTTTSTVVLGGVGQPSLYTTSVPNENITWEKTTTYNGGFESVFWNGLLSLEMDVFYKVTTDILQGQAGIMPPSIGGNYASTVNNGIVDVKGLEIVLGHMKSINKSFNYSINGNFTFARNQYVKIDDSPNIPEYQRRTGQPLGGVLGYISLGLYQEENDLRYSPKTSEEVRIGDIKYKDINGDGIINTSDRVWIAKNPIPQIIYGLNIDAQYKWVDFSLFFQGAAMSDIMLSGTYSALGYSDGTFFTQVFKWGSNPPKYLAEGSWTPENTNAEYPRLSTQSSSNNASISDFWKRDASYLRLKNAQIGVNIPKKVVQKIKVEAVRLYISGTNLLTFSKLKYIDPEAPSVNNGYYPQQRVFSFGLNVTL